MNVTGELLMFLFTGDFGPVRPEPCNECPWRYESTPGHLGPHTAEGWIEMAHADGPIWCHKTLPPGVNDMELPQIARCVSIRQCAGASRFRAHVHKMPRNGSAAVGPVDRETVFTSNDQFLDHHEAVTA